MYDIEPGQSPPPDGTLADPSVTPEDAEATEDSTGFTSLRDDIAAVTIEPPGTSVARQRGLSARLRPPVEVHLPDVAHVMTLSNPSGYPKKELTNRWINRMIIRRIEQG